MAESGKENKSLFERLFAAENLLCLAGIAVAVGGQMEGFKPMPLFYGACIVAGTFVLRAVRKKDWDKHWSEQERVQKAYQQRMDEERQSKGE